LRPRKKSVEVKAKKIGRAKQMPDAKSARQQKNWSGRRNVNARKKIGQGGRSEGVLSKRRTRPVKGSAKNVTKGGARSVRSARRKMKSAADKIANVLRKRERRSGHDRSAKTMSGRLNGRLDSNEFVKRIASENGGLILNVSAAVSDAVVAATAVEHLSVAEIVSGTGAGVGPGVDLAAPLNL
jgi:hypothetical protein